MPVTALKVRLISPRAAVMSSIAAETPRTMRRTFATLDMICLNNDFSSVIRSASRSFFSAWP